MDKNSIVPESVIANMQAYHVSAWNAGDMGREDPLEKEMATQSSTLAWRIPWSEEPGRLQVHGVAKSQSTEQTHTHTHFIQLFSPGNTALLINNIMLYTFCNLRGFRCKNHRNLWHFDGMSLVGKGEFVWIMNPPSRSSTHGPEGHITDLIVQTSH